MRHTDRAMGVRYGSASCPNQVAGCRVLQGGASFFLDMLPGIGDVKGGLEFFARPSWGGAAILGISIIPGGDLAKYGDEAFDLIRDGMRLGTNDALERSLEILGDGYRRISDGIFRSADGRFQVRLTDRDLAPRRGSPHINIERGREVTGPNGRTTFEVEENKHVYLPEEGTP